MFKDFSLLPMFKQLNFILSLLFTNNDCFSPSRLLSLVSVMICLFNYEEFIYSTISPLISECLLDNTPATMAILQKCTFSS